MVKTSKKDTYKIISLALHILTVVALIIISITVLRLSVQLGTVDSSHTQTELFNNARVTNLYECVQNKDYECPEWKYYDGRHFLDEN